MKKRIFSLFTSLVMVISFIVVLPTMTVEALTFGKFEYKILNDGTVEISRYTGSWSSPTKISIPSVINGRKVTSIGSGVFTYCGMTEVKIGNYVKNIGDGAFYATSLRSVDIPSSVCTIGKQAFSDCDKIKSVAIPPTVKTIGKEAFGYWHSALYTTRLETLVIKCVAGTEGERYAKENGFDYQLGVPTVAGFKFAATSAQAIKLTWNKVSGATGYTLYQQKSGKWAKVKSLKETNYTVSKLKAGTTYIFAVKAYKKIDTGLITSLSYPTVTTSTKPATVNFKIATANNKVALRWSKVTGATGYIVYYKTSANGKWQRLKVTTGTGYTKTGLTRGKTYWFTVKAYRKLGNTIYNGGFTTRSIKVR